jgi:hypothetical protein
MKPRRIPIANLAVSNVRQIESQAAWALVIRA